jgi:Methyltransferase FkbM domain
LGERIVKTIHIQTLPLLKIFETYAMDQIVDFISIDVEGYELEVLKSNNWKRYRPYLLVIKIIPLATDIIPFLKDEGYELVFKNSVNWFFIDSHSTCPNKYICSYFTIWNYLGKFNCIPWVLKKCSGKETFG